MHFRCAQTNFQETPTTTTTTTNVSRKQNSSRSHSFFFFSNSSPSPTPTPTGYLPRSSSREKMKKGQNMVNNKAEQVYRLPIVSSTVFGQLLHSIFLSLSLSLPTRSRSDEDPRAKTEDRVRAPPLIST